MNVTPSFFQVLGTRPARGRLFADADGTPGRNKVAVLSYTFAARQSGGIDGIVGSRLRLNDEVYDIVGVLPESFYFLSPEVRVFDSRRSSGRSVAGHEHRAQQNDDDKRQPARVVRLHGEQKRLDEP
jgi:hypothetical protein